MEKRATRSAQALATTSCWQLMSGAAKPPATAPPSATARPRSYNPPRAAQLAAKRAAAQRTLPSQRHARPVPKPARPAVVSGAPKPSGPRPHHVPTGTWQMNRPGLAPVGGSLQRLSGPAGGVPPVPVVSSLGGLQPAVPHCMASPAGPGLLLPAKAALGYPAINPRSTGSLPLQRPVAAGSSQQMLAAMQPRGAPPVYRPMYPHLMALQQGRPPGVRPSLQPRGSHQQQHWQLPARPTAPQIGSWQQAATQIQAFPFHRPALATQVAAIGPRQQQQPSAVPQRQ